MKYFTKTAKNQSGTTYPAGDSSIGKYRVANSMAKQLFEDTPDRRNVISNFKNSTIKSDTTWAGSGKKDMMTVHHQLKNNDADQHLRTIRRDGGTITNSYGKGKGQTVIKKLENTKGMFDPNGLDRRDHNY